MPADVVHSLEDVPSGRHVVTIGNFDGVHRGHQYLIQQVVRRAAEHDARSLVVTFDPLPLEVLRPEQAPPRLTTIDDRVVLIASLGVDTVVVQRFTPEFAQLSPEEFVERLVRGTRPVEIIVGEDFAFGRNRSGTPDVLRDLGKEWGFTVTVLDRVGDSEDFSSTRVRALLAQGDVRKASDVLGRPFSLTGRVKRGSGRGRTFGFPTANLELDQRLAIPADGIYAAMATVDYSGDAVPSVVYVGTRPTFQETTRAVEVHLLDFSGDLYGRDTTVMFIDRLRGDQQFASVDDLIEQMRRDEVAAREKVAAIGDSWKTPQAVALLRGGKRQRSGT